MTPEERIAQLAGERGGVATVPSRSVDTAERREPSQPPEAKPQPLPREGSTETAKSKPSPRLKALLESLKDAEEDFEWYPTTDEILETVADDLKRWHHNDHYYCRRESVSVMDVGAGDGRALHKLRELLTGEDGWDSVPVKGLYAIEKSLVHIHNMPKDVVVIGCDFHQQMLVDKRVSVLFCNPPYSEYEQWMLRILKESNVERIYLVVPRRWRDSAAIAEAVECANVTSLGEFDFENAERKARAKVEIVCIEIQQGEHDAFNSAIEAMLPELDAFDLEPDVRKRSTTDELKQLCEGGEIVPALVASYNAELDGMYQAYRDIVKMNAQLLKELGVTKDSILEGLRSKIVGLKDKYWSVLFDRLDVISKKLATKQRKQFLESLTDKAVIDFTEENIYSMLVWISKCASEHFDDQLVELFKSLAQRATVERYKSNKRVFADRGWRYLREDETHYRLCFRMVLETHGGTHSGDLGKWDYPNGLHRNCHELLGDWVTVANNLGFSCSASTHDHEWEARRKVDLMLDDGELLMDVRAYGNGNLHIRPNKKVMLAINAQAGKLLGWLRSADEAAEELTDNDEDGDFVREMFEKSNAIAFSNLPALLYSE